MNVFTIAGRELRSIFNTTIGWLVLAGFLLVTGLFWASMVSFYQDQSSQMMDDPYGGSHLNLTDYLLSPFFGNISVILLMVCPALAMRLFSEELKQRTMELLFTSPITTIEIVLGKFLGAVGFAAVMLACTAYVPFTLWMFGHPDFGAVAGGYAATLLVASSVIAIGMLFSAMTPNQVVALVLGFTVALGFWIVSWLGSGADNIPQQLSIETHIEDLVRGAIKLKDIVYFTGFIGFFLFATHQRVEAYRWR